MIWLSMEGLFVNCELYRVWKEVAVAYFNDLGLLHGTDEDRLKKKGKKMWGKEYFKKDTGNVDRKETETQGMKR
jgi:hypothetical protein